MSTKWDQATCPWISDKGSHFAMYDDQLAYFRELLAFLKSA